jgi:mannosyltransferase
MIRHTKARIERIGRPERWALAGLTLVAALLRFGSLDARGFWEDEVKTVLLLRLDFVDMLTRVAETEATPHLYYVLAWVWTRAFGDGEAGLRALSALAGTLTVPVVYAAAARLLSVRAGLVAAALTAVSPLLVWHAQDARSYALLGLLTALALLFFVRTLNAAGERDVLWWGVSSALALTTHYFAVFVVAPMAVWLLVRRPLQRARVVAVGAVALTGALLLPLARYQLREEKTSEETGTGTEAIEQVPIARRLVQTAAQFLVGPQPDLQRVSAAATGLLVLVAVALLATRAARSERRAASVALAIGGAAIATPVVLALAGVDFVLARNLLPAWAPLAIVAAAGLGASRAGRLGPGVAAALCLLSAATVVSTAAEPKFEREEWRGAAEALGAPAEPRAIVVTPDVGADALLFYRTGTRELPVAGARVRDIVVVGMPEDDHPLGESPEPPRPEAVRPSWPGFARVSEEEAEFFTVVRFRAREPRQVTPSWLSRTGLDETPAIFVETGR